MKIVVLSFVLFYCLNLCNAQSGKLDPSFGIRGIVATDMGSPLDYSSVGIQVLLHSDGSVYLVTQSTESTTIIKKNADGSTDPSYGHNGYSFSVPISAAHAAFQTDGKIVMVGGVSTNNQSSYNHSDFAVARVNIDGSLDTSFHGNGWLTGDSGGEDNGSSVAIQNDGKILVVVNSAWGEEAGPPGFNLLRYNADGSPDGGFNSTGGYKAVSTMAIQSDGKIVLAGDSLWRFNADLTPDSSFNVDGFKSISIDASAMSIQPDGKIITAGGHTNESGWPMDFVLSRYNANGSLDSTFGEYGTQTTKFGASDEWLTSIVIQNNGQIIAGGYTDVQNHPNFAICRYDTNGHPDSSFSGDGKQITDLGSNDYIYNVAVQSDEKILVLGYTNDGVNDFLAAARYDTNGTLDNTFDGDGILIDHFSQASTFFTSTAIQTDGKVLAAGYTWNGDNFDFAIVRYLTDGKLDPTFSGDGIQMTDFGSTEDKISAMEIQTDGKILVAGSAGDNFGIARYNMDGSLDISFDNDGMQITDFGSIDYISSLAIQTDGKILAGGSVVARYNTNGSIDTSFNEDGQLAIDCNDMAIQSDGRIIVVSGSYDIIVVTQYDGNGLIDSTFGENGSRVIWLNIDYKYLIGKSIAIQTDGKIVIGGYYEFDFRFIYSAFILFRLNADGSTDETFNGGQTALNSINAYSHATSVVVQNNNQIVIAGYSYNGSNYDFTMARYNPDGGLDYTFNNSGIVITEASPGNDRIADIAIGENKLYAAGFGQYHGNFGVVARYLLAPEGGPGASTFITAANGDWNDPGTWIGGIVPYSTSKVIVQHNVTITTNTTCYSLNVETTAGYLIINAGLNLTITH